MQVAFFMSYAFTAVLRWLKCGVITMVLKFYYLYGNLLPDGHGALNLNLITMAKIKWGMYVVDGRGKQGGHVLSKNRSGAYIRTKVTPSNPRTTAQMAVRGMFAAISARWSALTEVQRLSFEGRVTDYSVTDIFGDVRNPTGKNLFQKLNLNLENVGKAPVVICPEPIAVPYAELGTVEAEVSASTFMVNYSGNLTGNSLIVLATAPMSNGSKATENKLRQLEVFPGANGGSVDIWDAYADKFGAPVFGQNIYVGAKVVNANGQASPTTTKKAGVIV